MWGRITQGAWSTRTTGPRLVFTFMSKLVVLSHAINFRWSENPSNFRGDQSPNSTRQLQDGPQLCPVLGPLLLGTVTTPHRDAPKVAILFFRRDEASPADAV